MTETALFKLYRSTVHPALSLLLPWTFLLAASKVMEAIPVLPRLGLLFFTYLAAIGIAETVTGNIIRKERAGKTVLFRELLIIILLTYMIFSLFRSGGLGLRFFPALENIYPTIIAALAWTITFTVHEDLRDREDYLQLIAGKQGEALHSCLRDNLEFVGKAKERLAAVKRLSWTLFSVLILGLLVSWAFGVYPSTAAVIAVCVFTLVHILTISSLNFFLEEFLYAGDGLPPPPALLRKRLRLALYLAVPGFLLAVIFSSDASLLPLSLLEDILNRLFSLIPEFNIDLRPPRAPSRTSRSVVEALQKMTNEEDGGPSAFWSQFFSALRIVFITIGIGAAALFIFGPIFSKSFRRFLARSQPISFLKKKFEAAKRKLVIFFNIFRKKWKERALLLDSERRTKETRSEREGQRSRKSVLSRQKKRELVRLSKELAKVFHWGSKKGEDRKDGETLEEYLKRLGKVSPQFEDELQEIRTIYWEGRFSGKLLEEDKMKTMHSLVKKVVSVRN